MVTEVKPEQVTLVPDPPGVLTSNAGWKVQEHFDFLQKVIRHFKSHSIRTSIFVETDLDNIEAARACGTDRVELYTEPYTALYPQIRESRSGTLCSDSKRTHR